jgi:hypothetical protein
MWRSTGPWRQDKWFERSLMATMILGMIGAVTILVGLIACVVWLIRHLSWNN